MAMIRANFPKDLQEGLNAHFGLEYNEFATEYDKVFDTFSSQKAFEEDVLMAGFGPAPLKGEGEPFEADEARQGWTARYTHVTVGLKFSITQEAVEDNLYMQLGARYARSLARAMKETKEIFGANFLNNGFDSSNYPIGDGAALFSASHPLLYGGNGTNILSPAADISESSLEDVFILIRTAVDDRSIPVYIKPKRLVIPPQLIYAATRLLRSVQRPGTNENDINAIRALGVIGEDVQVVTRLTDPDAWFVKTDALDGLKYFQRIALQRGLDEDFNTGNAVYKARERWSFGVSDWRSIFGSAGAG